MYLNSNIYIIRNFISNNLFSKDILEFGLKTSSIKKVYISEVKNNDKFNYVFKCIKFTTSLCECETLLFN